MRGPHWVGPSLGMARWVVRKAADSATTVRVLAGAGIIRPYSPVTLLGLATTLRDWGFGPAGGFAALAVRNPHELPRNSTGKLLKGELKKHEEEARADA